MLRGIALGVSVAFFVASGILFFSGSQSVLSENVMTGAAIGVGQTVSYSLMVLIISAIAVGFFSMRIKKKHYR